MGIWDNPPQTTLYNRLGSFCCLLLVSLLSISHTLSSLSIYLSIVLFLWFYPLKTFVIHSQIRSLHVDVPHVFFSNRTSTGNVIHTISAILCQCIPLLMYNLSYFEDSINKKNLKERSFVNRPGVFLYDSISTCLLISSYPTTDHSSLQSSIELHLFYI